MRFSKKHNRMSINSIKDIALGIVLGSNSGVSGTICTEHPRIAEKAIAANALILSVRNIMRDY